MSMNIELYIPLLSKREEISNVVYIIKEYLCVPHMLPTSVDLTLLSTASSHEVIFALRMITSDHGQAGLDGLKARVRADVAWVQERVGAKMSRRARVSCCTWGAEKVAELSQR